jgi:hypothetical protein
MERWILIVGVLAIFLGLAVMGWHFEQSGSSERMCASPEAHCDERRL